MVALQVPPSVTLSDQGIVGFIAFMVVLIGPSYGLHLYAMREQMRRDREKAAARLTRTVDHLTWRNRVDATLAQLVSHHERRQEVATANSVSWLLHGNPVVWAADELPIVERYVQDAGTIGLRSAQIELMIQGINRNLQGGHLTPLEHEGLERLNRTLNGELAARAALRDLADRRAGTTGGRILVVEDDAPQLEIVVITLRSFGYEVETAMTGAAAIARLSSAETPDLVVLDLNLPDVHGFDVLRQYRERGAATRFLVVTGSDSAREAAQAGADEYLQKPFRLAQLAACVDRLIGPTAISQRGGS